jgi:hypothetical protein
MALVSGILFLAGFYSLLAAANLLPIVVFGIIRRMGLKIARLMSVLSAILLFGYGVYVFPEKRFENAFPGNLRFCANCFAQNT